MNKSWQQKFLEKVDSSQGPDACWPFTSYVTKNGYGEDRVHGRKERSHRIAMAISMGITVNELPKDKVVCHDPAACTSRACCNPRHLRLATHQENEDDKVLSGTKATGRRHGTHTKPHTRAYGSRNGTATCPGAVARGDRHGSRLHPELMPRGERNGQSKLTAAVVLEIRRLCGFMSTRAVARQFGVAQSTAARIASCEMWGHIK